jgi:hypothetical protein
MMNSTIQRYRNTLHVAFAVVLFLFGLSLELSAQRGAPAGPPPTAKAAAPVDLTGYWVSVVTEDWRFRMVTPKKGDNPNIPLNAEGRRVLDQWDPAKDEAAGEQCKAYGAANIMRMPGRIHIMWDNDNVLHLDAENGTQTRLLRFGGAEQSSTGAPTWQGNSIAQWQFSGGRPPRGGAKPAGGSLKVVTTHMRSGYLQLNGVPYSANAVLTEYFNTTNESNGDQWLIVTTVVEDPQYLAVRLIRSSHFKKIADASGWKPIPCAAR